MTRQEWAVAWADAQRAWEMARAHFQEATGPWVDVAVSELAAAEARLAALRAERPPVRGLAS